MELPGRIALVDLGIYAHNTLIISDIHIGYEEALNRQGVFVPRFQFREIIKRLDSIFDQLKNKKIVTIVIAGDLKHEFGSISVQEWRHTLQLLDYLGKKASAIVLLRGNHDTILGPIAQKRKVIVGDFFIISPQGNFAYNNGSLSNPTAVNKEPFLIKKTKNKSKIEEPIFSGKTMKDSVLPKKTGILIGHGDILPPKELLTRVKSIIIGHEHPAVCIRDGQRKETFKCFLIGKWKDKELIVMPSFNLVAEGTDVLKEQLLSPYLKQSLKNFTAIVVADKLYAFGKLKDIQH